MGRSSVNALTGTSGVAAKCVVVMPLVIFVLPMRIVRTPSPSRTMSRSGNSSPPWETKYAGPVISPGSSGVTAVPVPTLEPFGQLNGLASKVACRHALLSVVRARGQLQWQPDQHGLDVGLPRALRDRRQQARAARFARALPLVVAVNVGLNGSEAAAFQLEGAREAFLPQRTEARCERRLACSRTSSWSGCRGSPAC